MYELLEGTTVIIGLRSIIFSVFLTKNHSNVIFIIVILSTFIIEITVKKFYTN